MTPSKQFVQNNRDKKQEKEGNIGILFGNITKRIILLQDGKKNPSFWKKNDGEKRNRISQLVDNFEGK